MFGKIVLKYHFQNTYFKKSDFLQRKKMFLFFFRRRKKKLWFLKKQVSKTEK